MIYLFILLFSIINIYAAERLIPAYKRIAFFVAVSPALFVLIIFPSIQFGVGTDYYTYVDIYEWEFDQLERFFIRGEYVFYYIFKSIIDFKLGSQSIFIIASIFNMIMLMLFLTVLRKYGYSAWVLFFIFFVVTNIYHNQMNGIRQYMGLMIFPVLYIALLEKKYLIYFFLAIGATLFHKTAFISVLILPALLILRFPKNIKLALFVIIPFILIFVKSLVVYFVDNYFVAYSHYLTSSYGTGLDFSSLLTKLYYLPIFVYFWYLYLKDPHTSSLKGMEFGIAIWLLTYWIIILYLDFGFAYRISVYFIIFYLFPIYYVWKRMLFQGKLIELLLIILYLIFPYFLKVIFFPQGVFMYKSIFF